MKQNFDKIKCSFFSMLCCTMFLHPTWALVSEKVPLKAHEVTDIEKEFFADLDDGQLDTFSLFDGFLLASLVNKSSNFEKYKPRLDDIVAQVKKIFKYEADPYIKAESLLKWLHKNTFKSYYLNSFAYNIVANGDFNCLSSGILYALLAREIGLNVIGVLSKDHAYCRLIDPRGDKDIQTTVIYGFNPKGEKISQINNLTGFTYNPNQGQDSLQFVEMLPFIGALYANRVSLIELSSGTSDDHLTLYKKGFYFNPETNFFKHNIISSFFNLSIQAIKLKRYHEVPTYLVEAQQLAGPNSIVQEVWKTFYAEAKRVYATNHFQEAQSILEKGLEVFPGQAELIDLKTNILLNRFFSLAQAEFSQRNYDAALEKTKLGLKKLPDAKELIDLKIKIDSARVSSGH